VVRRRASFDPGRRRTGWGTCSPPLQSIFPIFTAQSVKCSQCVDSLDSSRSAREPADTQIDLAFDANAAARRPGRPDLH
jgi:hypothetical protein